FGASVAISGDTAIIGAKSDDVGANGDQGSAYVFVRSGTVWIEQARLFASDGAASDSFGYSVAIDGDTAVVGALQDNVSGNTDQGSAYVFVRSGTNWTEEPKLNTQDGHQRELFGVRKAVGGDNICVKT